MDTDSSIDLDVCNMSVLSDSEIASLARLEVSDWQEIKGGSFTESIQAWEDNKTDFLLGFCFLISDEPVGMTLFKRPPLCLGHKAFSLAVKQLKHTWPTVSTLMLGVDSDNEAALAVYRGYGMIDSGPIFKGNDGLENRFEMRLG